MRQLSRRGSPDTLAAHHAIEVALLRHVGMKDLLARVRPAKCGGSLREWPGTNTLSGGTRCSSFGSAPRASLGRVDRRRVECGDPRLTAGDRQDEHRVETDPTPIHAGVGKRYLRVGPQMSGLMTMAAFGGFLVAHVGNRTV